MEGSGKNSTIKLGRRKLHVQTAVSGQDEPVVSSVFDGGELVFKKKVQLSDDLTENRMQEEVEQVHRVVIADLELLFYVAEKVKNSDHAPSRNKLGRLFMQKNFASEAIQEFQVATELEPNKPEYYFDLGKAYYLKGDYQEAVNQLKLAAELAPVYADLHYALGFTHWKCGQYHESMLDFRRAIEFNESYHQAYYAMGLVLIDSAEKIPTDTKFAPPIERIRKACEYLRNAINMSDEYNQGRVEKALVLLDKRKISEAMDELLSANSDIGPKLDPASESEFFLKFMFAGQGKDDKMVDGYITAMEQEALENPEYADLRYNLGVGYLIKGRNMFLRAIEEFRKAVKINPSFEKAKKSLRLVENDGKGLLILLRAILK